MNEYEYLLQQTIIMYMDVMLVQYAGTIFY